jgi:fibro-slime domain-containing protein
MVQTDTFGARITVAAACLVFGLGVMLGGNAAAQEADTTYDTVDIITVPVTFYDFWQNGSNPEFERRTDWSEDSTNLVLDTLDDEKKPIRNPEIGWGFARLENIHQWYRPWDPTVPTYMLAETTLAVVAGSFHPETTIVLEDTTITYDTTVVGTDTTIDTTVTTTPKDPPDTLIIFAYYYDTTYHPEDTLYDDTCFMNAVVDTTLELVFGIDTLLTAIYDSVGLDTVTNNDGYDTLEILEDGRFVRIRYAVVGYDTTITEAVWIHKEDMFWPLNGKGLMEGDTNPNSRNNNFTMEMHNTFTYNGGEVLLVTSDDDSWTFINGLLALDLGGFRPPTSKRIYLDSLADTLGLVVGETYDFDLFYAERKTGGVLDIVTNIVFDDATPGTKVNIVVPAIRKLLRPDANAFVVGIGRGVQIKVPSATRSISLSLFNARGQRVRLNRLGDVRSNMTMRGDGILGNLPAGLYMVQAKCYDSKGQRLTSLSERMMLAR